MKIVYILKCNDETFYIGCSGNLEQRINAHRRGTVKYTSKRLPINLVTYIHFNDDIKAYNFERYLKSGSGKAFMKKRLV